MGAIFTEVITDDNFFNRVVYGAMKDTIHNHAKVTLDCFAVSVFFMLFSLQASVTVKICGGAISNDLMVAPSHFGCKQRLLKLNHIQIPVSV